MDATDIDAVMDELADVPAVLFVNVRVSARWRDAVNQTLAEAVGRHRTSRLVDWYGTSAGHPDWFQSDGTHFRGPHCLGTGGQRLRRPHRRRGRRRRPPANHHDHHHHDHHDHRSDHDHHTGRVPLPTSTAPAAA